MQVQISTILKSAPDRIWQEVQTSRLLQYISQPLLVFTPVSPSAFPETWGNGNYQVRMWLFGVLPLGTQWIVIRHIASSEGYDLLDDGHGNLITRWQHLISLRPTPGGFTLYTDTVNIDARWLTFGVWLFANIFYRYRQSRWRRLVRRNFNYDQF
ncbi:MAG: hypothetical protein AB1509_00695 [Chloroflexota bacterium]|nr:hypothetical protein [Chloroflexi bacterium CFX2]NOH00589.1 hypothetical protein [Chloroflexota bacterium]WKZ36338.1 MAG: hypothetical protein QY332_00175 [Anaerolineales bacterium]